MAASSTISTLQGVLADPPLVHGPRSGGDLITHGLLQPALEWLEQHVDNHHRTLETGSGLSTLIFALRGAEHRCIVPNAPEVERLRDYCAKNGIELGRVTFDLAPSERVLPGLDTGPLDVVLIDGSHSFPQVFIDWFYTQTSLQVGGTLIVDDVHVWSGRLLRDFLAAEPEWELTNQWWGRTVAFRKASEVDPDKLWTDQPYVWRRSRPTLMRRALMAYRMVRQGNQQEVLRRLRPSARR